MQAGLRWLELPERGHALTDHHKTRCGPKEAPLTEIQFDTRLPAEEEEIPISRLVRFLRFWESSALRSCFTSPLPVRHPRGSNPSHVRDHSGRCGVRQIQGGVFVRRRLEFDLQPGGHHGADPGSGGGQVNPQSQGEAAEPKRQVENGVSALRSRRFG